MIALRKWKRRTRKSTQEIQQSSNTPPPLSLSLSPNTYTNQLLQIAGREKGGDKEPREEKDKEKVISLIYLWCNEGMLNASEHAAVVTLSGKMKCLHSRLSEQARGKKEGEGEN